MFITPIQNPEDSSKLERLYVAHYKAMYYRALQEVKNHHLAEEAIQETCIRVMNNLYKIDENNFSQARSYLLMVCTNAAKDIKKKHFKQSNYEQIEDYPIEDIRADVEHTVIVKDTLNTAVNKVYDLDPIYRDPYVMKTVFAFNRKNIASSLGITIEALKKRLTRAHAKLILSIEEGERVNEK